MAEPMENGPRNYNGDAEQVWERPWTLDEMRKSSADWSLAADSGLFLYLQDFSQWMLSKTHEIEKQLDGLIRDTKATDSCLHTVFNDFLMLSNIQFIENRVYDEEVEEPNTKAEAQEKHTEQEKSREQKEAELIPKVQEAVNYGLKVLESAFEQLDIKVGNSDSEDEEAADRVEPILEPKDLYVDRPLPYLIGSQAFMEQDDIGLGDLSSDEMSIDSDRDIESEEGKNEEEHSDEDFDQDEEGQGSIKQIRTSLSVVSYDEEEDEDNDDSDLFGESDKDDDDARSGDLGPTSFAEELAARIKGDKTNKPEADRASLASAMSVSKKKNKGKKVPKSLVQNDDMFKPPEMEADEYSPFGEKGGLFSGGKGLFDDDDEGDLFSEISKKDMVEKEQTTSKTTESVKTRKIPAGAVSIFPGSLENKENSSAFKPKVQAAPEQVSSGGGLFDYDNDDEDDDFFSGKTLKKSLVTQEKPKPKTTTGLFGGDEDDEEADIFSASSRSAFSQQSKKTVKGEEAVQPPEKKLPAGAVSMFGPGTKTLLGESLKKSQSTTSDISVTCQSEENVPPPVAKPSPPKSAAAISQCTSLFSDDEDSQVFSAISKSQLKPEVQSQKKTSKTKHSIFDDDEEEDLFSSVPKSESIPGTIAGPKPKKTVSSGLFCNEDQWMNDQPSTVTAEGKSGGLKSSNSAPSMLQGAKGSQKSRLFDDDHGDDLFVATKESSQKKSQKVSLLFENEDEDKGPLFGFNPNVNKGTPDVKVSAGASQAPSLFDSNHKASLEKRAEDKSEKKTLQTTSTPEESDKSKEHHVDLFGGISVLGDGAKSTMNKTNSYLEDDDLEWHKDVPPPMDSKEKRTKKNTLSLFDDDDDDDEEEGPDKIFPFSTATKPSDKNTLKAQEEKGSVKSTGVFQDEELLFSQTQQRDNDPEVDLFAASTKTSGTLSSSVKPAAPTLFGDDDDDDDLFSTAKPKAPPKVPVKPSKPKNSEAGKVLSAAQSPENEKSASAVKHKETSSKIGKLQASLAINPASLMPVAGHQLPVAVSIMPTLAHSLSPRAAGSMESKLAAEGGVSFETPPQATTLQNANKDRVRGAMRRRPQTRAARHLAAQHSEEEHEHSQEEPTQTASGAGTTSLPPFNPVPVRPSALTIPVMSSATTAPIQTAFDEMVRPKSVPTTKDDLFSSQDLFASALAPKHSPSPQPKTKPSEPVSNGASKKKDPALSIFDDHSDDLFATVKPKPVKQAKAMAFLNNNDEDEEDDLFGTEKKHSKTSGSSSKPDIFQDEIQTLSQVPEKPTKQSLDTSLFDDNVDIFADLTLSMKPKEKKVKKKVETKSIFDDDMDDIFSSGLTKPVLASSSKKSKKHVQEGSSAEESGHSIIDDPLNVFSGN